MLTLLMLTLTAPALAQVETKSDTPPSAVKVVVDTSDAPETAEWGKKAGKLVEEWHPRIAKMLPSDGYTPPNDVRIVFKKNMKGVAFASGKTITISAQWIKDNPNDYGMVVHELTHVIQGYRKGGPSWLVEGIADYIRFLQYEPKTKIRIDTKKASYRDSYRTTAKFLGWVEKTYDKELIQKLNSALRAGKYDAKLFEASTMKTLDQLWAEFISSEERARGNVQLFLPAFSHGIAASSQVRCRFSSPAAVCTVC